MKKTNIWLMVLLTLAVVTSCTNKKNSREVPSGDADRPRIVNIINFVRLLEPRDEAITEDVLYQTVVSQIKIMRKYKLGGTFLLQYDALMDPRYQRLMKSLPEDSFEIGAWWEIPRPLVEKAGYKWRGRYPWDWHANVGFATGYTPGEREKLVDVYMADFKRIFGYYPGSVGSWFIDAHTLEYLYEKYGIVASCNCKDQVGTDGYSLWGGYWNQAYYPSRKNAYMPAQHAEKQIPVPVFRMLGSDPIRQYDNGIGEKSQKVVTLEPVYPESGGNDEWVHWYFKQFVEGACMEYAYVQAGQENSFTWATMSKGYKIQMPLIARLRDENKICVKTLAEAGEWFRKKYEVTPATSVTVREDLPGSNKKTVWFDSRFYRANLLWEDHTLRFRDIHIFNEELASDYLTRKGTSTQCHYYTLPFVDGYLWSSKDKIAGLRFKTTTEGKEEPMKGGDPTVDDSERGHLHISWPLMTPGDTLLFDIDEKQMKIKMTGQDPPAWFLDLTTANVAQLPFKKIATGSIICRYQDMEYSVTLSKGRFINGGDKSVFSIHPEEDAIVLHFAQP